MKKLNSKEFSLEIPTHSPDCPFSILGLTTSATLAEIKKAHRELVKLFHPDKYERALVSEKRREEFKNFFNLLNSARDTLLDPTKRYVYEQHGFFQSRPEAREFKKSVDHYLNELLLKTLQLDACLQTDLIQVLNQFMDGDSAKIKGEIKSLDNAVVRCHEIIKRMRSKTKEQDKSKFLILVPLNQVIIRNSRAQRELELRLRIIKKTKSIVNDFEYDFDQVIYSATVNTQYTTSF